MSPRCDGGPGLVGTDGKLWPLGQPFYILEATDLNVQAPASLGWSETGAGPR